MPKKTSRKKNLKSSKRNSFLKLIFKYKFIFIIAFALSGLLFFTKLNDSELNVLGVSTSQVEVLSESQAQSAINTIPKSTACGNQGQAACPKFYLTKVIIFNDNNKNLKQGENDDCYWGDVRFTVNGIEYKTYMSGCKGAWIISKLKKNTISAPSSLGNVDSGEWSVYGLNYKDSTTNGNYIYKKGKKSQLITISTPNLMRGNYLNFSYTFNSCRGDSSCN